ncbi:DUF397 domain-containing protein [Nonomuraea sp. NPDC046570]|uniref:DUF397 domain-containing protein n=1 Tax=Nonomuraea sp. NPDC046570 TaxID=3155255 RepID=UPI0033DCF1D0
MTQNKPSATDFDLSSLDWISGALDPDIKDPVEIAHSGENILMRNGGSDDDVVLVFTRAEWDAFVAGALNGEFDYE